MADLEDRALEDLIEYPDLADRIFHYFARRNRSRPLIDLFVNYRARGEDLYEATDADFFAAALLLVPDGHELQELRTLAVAFANKAAGRSKPLAGASAILLLYWMGSSGQSLEDLYTREQAAALPKEVARAWLACTVARSPESLARLQGQLLGHPSDDVARLARFLTDLIDGALTSMPRLGGRKPRWPQSGWYYDAHQWLLLELTASSPSKAVRVRVADVLPAFAATAGLAAEKRVFERIKELMSRPPAAGPVKYRPAAGSAKTARSHAKD